MDKPFELLKRAVVPLRPVLKPSVLVVGAQKAGTSALFDMLIKHPKVIAPSTKELTFFCDDKAYSRGIKYYNSLLPLRPLRGSGWITLDATPDYLSHPAAAERIHQHLPNAVLVTILRDPVRRAFSDWNMFRQFKDHWMYAAKYDPRTFEEAMREELAGPPNPVHYLRRGYYAQHISRFYNFFPREQILLFPYPQFKRDPEAVVAQICELAGLSAHLASEQLRKVKANVRPYETSISEALRQELYTHFEPHRKALCDLLGRDIDLEE